MTHTVVVRFAPLTSLARVNDERWKQPGRTLFDTGALTMVPGQSEIPLLVDHRDDRPIGLVTTIFRHEDIDGPWLCAVAQVTELPCWLRKHETKASFSYKPLHTNRDVFGCEIARRGLLTEVSVLSSSTPAEPLARVVAVRPIESKPSPTAVLTSDRSAVGGLVVHGMTDQEFEREVTARDARLIAEGVGTRRGRATLMALGLLEVGEMVA